ncbi:hypothetical protein [Spirosoma fluviale]|uniref:Uncharacterized protein n=1 Tax=Spirosoma fluviale TaxID=1597977 RepID=A0A286FCV0_9BACT|nr:hypothetical protein [Spirosoma fluviale]SOD81058.1 hypothetical protein SAMN06269250_1660 [Spirosoma fluviale]
MREDPTKLTGLDLLEKLLDLEAQAPDKEQWVLDHPKHYPPMQVRLKQLAVLVKVFIPELAELSLKDSLEALLAGDFISDRNLQAYTPILAYMSSQQMKGGYQKGPRPKDPGDENVLSRLESCYRRLVRFKRQAAAIKAFNQGVLEADWYMMYSVMLSDSVGKAIDLGEIDYFLGTIIDPERRHLSEVDLINTYGYPSEDLFDLDLDFL